MKHLRLVVLLLLVCTMIISPLVSCDKNKNDQETGSETTTVGTTEETTAEETTGETTEETTEETTDDTTNHEHTFVEGKCECGETDPNYVAPEKPATYKEIELTVDSLGIESQTYAAGTATVNGAAFEFIQLGNYGDGIQMRDKEGKTSYLWNTEAFSGAIARIELVYSSTKDVTYANPDAVIFTFGNEMGAATYTTKLSTSVGVKTYTITPDAETYKFFKLEHDLGYSFYWDSITIVLVDGTTVNPGTPEQPPVDHTHEFVNGECACGEKDPNYQPPHTHEFVNGECACGEKDPNYQPPHTHEFVNGECACGEKDPNYVPPEPPATSNKVELTVDSLGIASNTYAAGTATVGGTAFEFIQIGNYGDGIQMRDKNGNTSSLWNTAAFSSAIARIELVYSASKDVTYANPDAVIFTFGNEMGAATYTTKLSTTAGVKTYTITPDAETYKFFKLEHDLGYTFYWASITIVLTDGTTVNPGTPEQPPVEHTHEFVNGECACGEKDPNYVAPEAPSFGVIDAPVAGTAYKFGMVQGKLNDGKVYYLKGGMSSYYMATSTKVEDAIDFYLEATEGGYYLYCLVDGVKTYVNMVVSGTHVNGAYEATAKTVYTYDAVSKTIIATVDGAPYWFGTRNDNTYTTVGPCKTEYNGFYCQFYGVTSGSTPEQPPVEHTHEFVNGECACGEKDPNYVPPTPPVASGNSADFDTIVLPAGKENGNSSYTGPYTTTNGWTIENSAIQCGGANDINPQFTVIGPDNTHKAPCLNGKTSAPGKLTSPTLSGGISKLTINYTKMFTDTKLSVTVTVTDLATGNKQTHTISAELEKNDKYIVYTDEWTLETPVTGDFTIEIVNNCPSNTDGNKDRFTILDVIWEGVASAPATPATETFTFADYVVSGELGGGEAVRNLGDNLTFTISSGWITSDTARIYKNSNAVIKSNVAISSMTINAGYKTDTFKVYVSEDGETWVLLGDYNYVTEFGDVTINFATATKYVKIDACNNQVRIKTLSVVYA